MDVPDEWPSRRATSRQNPAYRPADMIFLPAPTETRRYRLQSWCPGAGRHPGSAAVEAAPAVSARSIRPRLELSKRILIDQPCPSYRARALKDRIGYRGNVGRDALEVARDIDVQCAGLDTLLLALA